VHRGGRGLVDVHAQIGQHAAGDALAGPGRPAVDERGDAAPRLAVGDAEQPKRLRGDRLLDSQKSEQEVLGPDLRVFQRPRFALGRSQRLPGVGREPLDHRFFQESAAARADRSACPAILGPCRFTCATTSFFWRGLSRRQTS